MIADRVGATRLIRADSPEAWDAFVTRSPQYSVFASSAFLDVQGDAQKWFLEVDGRVAAAMALMVDADGNVLPAPQPYAMYYGIAFADWSAGRSAHHESKWQLETLKAAIELLAARYDRLSFSLHPSLRDIRAFQWFRYEAPAERRFRVDLRYTGRLAVSPKGRATFMRDARQARRYDEKRAVREGVRFERSRDVDILLDLHVRTLQRQGLEWAPRERALLRAIAAHSVQSGAGELGVCKAEGGEPIAAALFLHDASCGYYLASGTDPARRATGAGTLVVTELIRAAIDRGVSSIDFCGMNSPQRADFKSSFNATVEPFFNVHLG